MNEQLEPIEPPDPSEPPAVSGKSGSIHYNSTSKFCRWFMSIDRALKVVSETFEKSGFFRLLDTLGKLGLAYAIVQWVLETKDRQDARHNQAWTLVELAKGTASDGGRAAAIKQLVDDKMALDGIELGGAIMHRPNFLSAQLFRADFEYSHLDHPNFTSARLDMSFF